MVKLATKQNPKFEVSDIEYKSEGKSYSLITVKKLIEHGADVNTINKDGQTNLILAVGENKPHICSLLVKKGANPDIKDSMGMSAYEYAVLFKNQEIIDILSPFHKE